MKKTVNKSQLSLSLKNRDVLKSFIFLIPIIYGLVFFFLIPVVKSLLFSVSDVTSGPEGYGIHLSGFSSYNYIFNEDTEYRQTVVKAMMEVLAKTPLIIIFSFFMASVLNQNFKGKTVFRVILFMPVILEILTLRTNTLENQMGSFSDYKNSGADTAAISFVTQFSDWMTGAGISSEISETVISLVNQVYSIIGLSAIQILILLIAMQSISPSLYEAATVEGATGWESFWKITFPMVSPMILTCIIYTIIDSFTSSSNGVMSKIYTTAFEKLEFSISAAMGWFYFAVIAVILGIVALIFKKFVFSYDE